MSTALIPGGFICLARKIEDHELWQTKPAGWVKIWLHILLNVQYADSVALRRGQGVFQQGASLGRLGTVTPKQWEKCIVYLRSAKPPMIETQKTQRGLLITVMNYGDYQDIRLYQDTEDSRVTPPKPPKNPKTPPSSAGGRQGHETWLTPYGDLWGKVYQGEMEYGIAANALSKLKKRYPDDILLPALSRALHQIKREYWNWSKFAATIGTWIPKAMDYEEDFK